MQLSFPKLYMSKARLETIVDGVFAIVMTLLVMPLVIPQRNEVIRDIGFETLLANRAHDIINYALSFIILSLFWVQHHELSHFIKQTDRVHIWINIFMLMFIALVPFSTSLVSEFPERNASELIFGFNMLMISILAVMSWVYATRNRHLVDGGITDEQIAVGRNKCVFFMLLAVIAIVLSQVHPLISADIFWIMPALVLLNNFFRKRK